MWVPSTKKTIFLIWFQHSWPFYTKNIYLHHHTILFLVQFQHMRVIIFLHLNMYAWIPVADPGRPRGPWPPSPVEISHKRDGHQRRPHRFHVSCPTPPPAQPGRWIRCWIPSTTKLYPWFSFSIQMLWPFCNKSPPPHLQKCQNKSIIINRLTRSRITLIQPLRQLY